MARFRGGCTFLDLCWFDLDRDKECGSVPIRPVLAFPSAVVLEATTECLRTDILLAKVFVSYSLRFVWFPVGLEEHVAGFVHQGAVVLAWVQAIATSGPMFLGLLGLLGGVLTFFEDGVRVGR